MQVDAHNTQMGPMEYVNFWELLKGGLRITYKRPSVLDFAGVEIHLSKTSGFTPNMAYPNSLQGGDGTRIYAGPQDDITIAGVTDFPDTYFMLVAGVDAWGRDGLDWSDEEQISTADGVEVSSIEWKDVWGDGRPEDGAQVNNPSPAWLTSEYIKDIQLALTDLPLAITIPAWLQAGGVAS